MQEKLEERNRDRREFEREKKALEEDIRDLKQQLIKTEELNDELLAKIEKLNQTSRRPTVTEHSQE